MTLGLWADRATSIFSKSSTEGARASSCSSCVAKSKLSVVDSTAMGTCQSRYDCPTKSGSILRTFNLSHPLDGSHSTHNQRRAYYLYRTRTGGTTAATGSLK